MDSFRQLTLDLFKSSPSRVSSIKDTGGTREAPLQRPRRNEASTAPYPQSEREGNTVPQRRGGWIRLWLFWTIATLAGSLLGAVISAPLMFIFLFGMGDLGTAPNAVGIVLIASILGVMSGVPRGLAEWLVLRGRLAKAGWWIPATIIGCILGYILSLIEIVRPGALRGMPLSGIGAATVLAILQGPFLRRRMKGVGAWVLASFVGTGLVQLATSFAQNEVSSLAVSLFGPVFVALLSAIVVVALLEQPAPSKRSFVVMLAVTALSLGTVWLPVGIYALNRILPLPGFTREVGPSAILAFPREVESLDFSEDGKTLAVGSVGQTTLIDVQSRSTRRSTIERAEPFSHGMESAVFSPDGTMLGIASTSTGMVNLWDVNDGTERSVFNSRGSITGAAFSPDGRSLAASSVEGVWLWDTAANHEYLVLSSQDIGGQLFSGDIAYSPDGKMLATAISDRSVIVWDTSTWHQICSLGGHADAIFSLAFSPDSTRLVTGSGDKTIRLWDTSSGELIRTMAGHNLAVLGVAFSPNGRLIASASTDGTAKLWDLGSGEVLLALTGHTEGVKPIVFSPDGELIATGSFDRTVRFWNVPPELQ